MPTIHAFLKWIFELTSSIVIEKLATCKSENNFRIRESYLLG